MQSYGITHVLFRLQKYNYKQIAHLALQNMMGGKAKEHFMIKKVLLCLLLCLLVPFGSAFAELSFPDLPESHWAHGDVSKMVADGRVNGFPDGEFKPNENVTRWQFVKMMGGSNPDETSEPHRAATRGEAAEFLWIKAGSPDAIAPSAVTKNTVNEAAAAWAYSVGIMEGDDGLNLRLDSTLTRAEAAALIIRSEGELGKNNFIDTVDPIILEKMWNAMGTGKEYNESATITNGELAYMAVRLGYERRNPDYQNLIKNPEFEGEYAKALQLVAQDCLGDAAASAEYHDKAATMQDMISVLSYYAMKQSAESPSYSPEKNYSDAVSSGKMMAEMGIKFARHNGVFLYADDTIKATNHATMKEIACVLVQLDEIVGLNKSAGVVKAQRVLKTLYGYPANSADYAYILADVPGALYETELIEGEKPADDYTFISDYRNSFVLFLDSLSANLPEGVKVEWTFMPSLACESDNDTVFRAKLKILENPNGLTLNQIFASNTLAEEMSGDSFYVDISVGAPITNVIIDTANYKVIRAFIG